MPFRDQPYWFTASLVAMALFLSAAFTSAGVPGQIKRRYGAAIPEAGWSYGPSSLDRFFRSIGWDGLNLYRTGLRWDVGFAIVLSLLLIDILEALWGRVVPSGSALRWLVYAPAVYGVVDVLEDVFLLVATQTDKFLPRVDGSGLPMACMKGWVPCATCGSRRGERSCPRCEGEPEPVFGEVEGNNPSLRSWTLIGSARRLTKLKWVTITLSVLLAILAGYALARYSAGGLPI